MSLRLKFGVLISLIVLLASGGGAIYIYQRKSVTAEQSARQRAERITNMLSRTVTQSVADFDLKTIEDHLSGAVKDPEILKVKGVDAKGETMTEKVSEKSELDAWDFESPIKKEAEELGKIILTFSSTQFKSELRDTLRTSLYLALGITFFIVVASFLLFRTLVDTRLRKMEQVTEQVEKGEVDARVPTSGRDEIGRLGSKFNVMLDEVSKSRRSLEEANATLELKVLDRTREIRTIVDNVKAGIFIVRQDLLVQPGFTRSCSDLGGSNFLEGTHICAALGMSARVRDTYPSLVMQVFEDILPEEMSLDQLPNRVEINGRTLGIQGSALRNDKKLVDGILFTLTDVTELVRAEEEMRRNQAIINILSQKDAFLGFLSESRTCLQQGRVFAETRNSSGVRAALHTLKGNSAVFGLHQVASVVHRIEDKEVFAVSDFDTIEAEFRLFLNANSAVLKLAFDEGNEPVVEIGRSELLNLEQITAGTLSREQMAKSVIDWLNHVRLRPAKELLGPISDFTEKLSERLGKKVEFSLRGGEIPLDPELWKEMLGNVIHMVRNSIDHGVEAPWERGAKCEVAKIWIALSKTGNTVDLEVGDDGKGIDANKVAQVALAKKLVTADQVAKMSEQQKLCLIFEDSISTAEQITSISGRGVGMTAVRQAVEKAKGTLFIDTNLGVGTRIKIGIVHSDDACSRFTSMTKSA